MARQRRPRPGLDDKVLTGWNGLMIAALARAAAAFEEPRYADAAQAAATFILEHVQRDGRLLAVHGKGRARFTAYSTDYAFFIEGLLELFQATADFRWLTEAERLADVLVEHYSDDERAGFFLTAQDHEELLVRSRAAQDGATPAANSVMLGNLLKLSSLLDRRDLGERGERLVRSFGRDALNNPFQSERMLAEIDAWQSGLIEIVVAGDPASESARDLLRAARSRYLPGSVIVPFDPLRPLEAPASGLFAGRTTRDGRAMAYVCRNAVCQQPAETLAQLAEQLDGAMTSRSEAQRAG